MMMTNKNAKTSFFPRRCRPVAGHPTGRTRQRSLTLLTILPVMIAIAKRYHLQFVIIAAPH
ncbi:hypothetical protein QEQ13_004807 [Salmonella enterica]|nr:hypothetical protein [Salmonella enterica]